MNYFRNAFERFNGYRLDETSHSVSALPGFLGQYSKFFMETGKKLAGLRALVARGELISVAFRVQMA